MTLALAIDFGSTYTKAVALDLAGEKVAGVAQAPSTVGTDITIGLAAALEDLRQRCGVVLDDVRFRAASSSAAGGLRMVAIGLVPELTAEAARRAALGAGAKIIGVFSYTLGRRDLAELSRLTPDIVLLAGGTDGGDRKTIVANARSLTEVGLRVPVVVAGNRSAQDEVQDVLEGAGIPVRVVDNVMPELGRINVEPAQAAVRETFMDRIVTAKGLDRVETFVGRVAMPTPMAVLEAARLLADGVDGEPGLGDLLVLDVGGATTDVHSVGRGAPTEPELVPHGLPEPYAKRTVEGDLGIRINAASIMEAVGAGALAVLAGVDAARVTKAVERLGDETSHVPEEAWEHALDAALARSAVGLAVDRHVGRIDIVNTPDGQVRLLVGKDLRNARAIVGTGGVFARGRHPRRVVEGALFDAARPLSMRPQRPEPYVDGRYILFALGLVPPEARRPALRILKRELVTP
jgi:uncharacterized protein (TIGR01319 family)